MKFLKKHWGNILFVVIILLLLIPQTRLPIQVMINRIVSFSPSEIKATEREQLSNYNWNIENKKGEVVNFTKSKNQLTLINYWATWFGPCIAEMPSLQALYDKYINDMDFYFITSEQPNTVEKFMNKKGFDLPIHYFISDPPKLLQSRSLPTTFIIDQNGKIIFKKSGAANWNSKLVRQTLDDLIQDK
ncbi:TlpA family protein disulfide reductase [Psychroflexus aestuariivivens]|uniref:TlpA family protein disulfide reductase n=1 Tax=Psychroflexus aestuariivivens TaxID=1795040 RepID=UPI000FDB217E|nr:TlpA disulfide reductase family protein [Psychroflexus aestuariivivens]